LASHLICRHCGIQRERINVPLVEIDVGLLAYKIGISAADTLDLGQGVHDLLLSIHVGVEETKNLSKPARATY
jgi:hypothetical protein